MPDNTEAATLRAWLEAIITEEESKATALEQMAIAARQRVPSAPSSASSLAVALPLVPTTSLTYEDTVVAGLHLQAVAVLNVHQLVNIILDNYACWCDLMEQALQGYALLEHVTDDAPSTDPGWIRMDNVVLNWISNSILADLHQVVRERGCTVRHLWLTIENQFLDNHEHRTLHLDAAFHTFIQGDLSVNEYCRKFKAMADGLADLGAPIDDRILVLNILRGLNQRFKHVGSIIQRYSPFPNFLKVHDDLLLEELQMDNTGPLVAPTALYTNIASLEPKPPSFTPSRPPHGGNGGTSGNWSKYHNKNYNSGNGGGHNDKNSTGDGGHGGSSSQTIAPTGSDGRTNALWLTYGHPWQGHMTMYPSPMPARQRCLHAFMATPGLYASPAPCPGSSSSSSSRCTNKPPWA
jgi:hypothetical protein